MLWAGPFFVPGRKQWWPTRFLRYENELYCSVEIGWSTFTLLWKVGSDEVGFEDSPFSSSGHGNGPELWEDLLEQVERRLRSAIMNPAAYNRRVARLFPFECRTGRIQRRLTWPKSARRPLSTRESERLQRALERGRCAPSWSSLSLRRYLEVASMAYDAVFDELGSRSPLEKYQSKADRRPGGMLDLPPDDTSAFERWHSSREWAGAHPWEIVFAHPHGILLSPLLEEHRWRFLLSVDTLGLYADAVRMAIALGDGDVPFELFQATEISAALRGEDEVEVGPFYGQISFEELEHRRRGASARVEWDAPPTLSLREPGEDRGVRKGST